MSTQATTADVGGYFGLGCVHHRYQPCVTIIIVLRCKRLLLGCVKKDFWSPVIMELLEEIGISVDLIHGVSHEWSTIHHELTPIL